MLHQLARPLAIAAVAALLVVAMPALAGDGVIELNQAKILAAGGFPFTIASPGSYKLTSNLTMTGGANALTMGVDGITLDLNGFSIVGSGLGCPTVSDRAIGAAAARKQIVIRNGIINGFCFGILLGTSTDLTVEGVSITTLGNTSIATGANAVLRGNHFRGANSSVTCPSIVVETSFIGSSGNNALPTTTCAKANLIGNF